MSGENDVLCYAQVCMQGIEHPTPGEKSKSEKQKNKIEWEMKKKNKNQENKLKCPQCSLQIGQNWGVLRTSNFSEFSLPLSGKFSRYVPGCA